MVSNSFDPGTASNLNPSCLHTIVVIGGLRVQVPISSPNSVFDLFLKLSHIDNSKKW